MFQEFMFGVLAGIVGGPLTLIPGLHPNLVSLLVIKMVESHGFLIGFSGSLSMMFSLLAAVGSGIFQHFEFSDSGEKHEVIQRTLDVLCGSLGAIFLLLILSPLLISFLKIGFPVVKPLKTWLLFVVVVVLFIVEKKKIAMLATSLVAGSVGMLAFSGAIEDVLTPLFVGLYALPGLLMMVFTRLNRAVIPSGGHQSDGTISLQSLIAPSLLSSVLVFLPGIGPGQVHLLSQGILFRNRRRYALGLGAVNAAATYLSFLTLYSFHQSRQGAVEIVGKLVGYSFETMLLFVASGLIAVLPGVLFSFVLIRFSEIREDWKRIAGTGMLIVSISLVGWISGVGGISLMMLAAAAGFLPGLLGCSRIHLLFCLLVPLMV